MTNAEKYLKNGVDIKQMATEMVDFFDFPPYEGIGESNIEEFFGKEVKPTLTEDERVILRNIDKKYKRIGRTDYDARVQYLYVNVEDGWKPHIMQEFDHLFQFIKERRRILY